MYFHLSFQCFVSQQFEAIDFKTSFESQKKNFWFSSLNLNLKRLATFLGSDWKNMVSCEKKHNFFLTLLFLSFYNSESGSTNPNECGSDRIRIHITEYWYEKLIASVFFLLDMWKNGNDFPVWNSTPGTETLFDVIIGRYLQT